MKIAFFRYSLFNRGGDRLSLAYANYLAIAGHDVTLYVTELNTVFEIARELKVVKLAFTGRVGFLRHAVLNDLHQDVVIVDIIHLHLALSLRNKVIYYAQADDVEYTDNPMARTLVDLLYRLHFLTGRPMISMSRHLTDIFRSRYACRGEIHTLKTGIDHSSFFPDPDRKLLDLKGDKRSILFMARGDSYRKGYDLAMDVFASLKGKIGENSELWVCGERLEEDRFGFTVRNFGVVSDGRLREILSSADIFFYPSRHEGFGLFPLEAMACGAAVVTTEAIPYALGIPCITTVPIGDTDGMRRAIVQLLGDASGLDELKAQGSEAAKEYDLAQTKADFSKAVASIARNRTS